MFSRKKIFAKTTYFCFAADPEVQISRGHASNTTSFHGRVSQGLLQCLGLNERSHLVTPRSLRIYNAIK